MNKRALCLLLSLLLTSAALAEPLVLESDLTDEIREKLNGKADYIYSFRYPQVDPADPSAELINNFFRYKAEDAAGFEVPMNADFYRGQDPQEDIRTDISYTVTCNNESFFSLLVENRQEQMSTWTGYTFSRKDLKPGLSVALPYLLGLLRSEETDTWLQDRQTARADALVREMVWERLQEKNGNGLKLHADLEKEILEYFFFPEEDFFLSENGDPVFYLQPGMAEDSERLITVTIPIADILDEL